MTLTPITLLPIDECEEWIGEILNSTKDSGFENVVDEGKEFLIFNTNDFHADTKALYKIRKITGMRLAQISTHNNNTQLWFYRSTHHIIRRCDYLFSGFCTSLRVTGLGSLRILNLRIY